MTIMFIVFVLALLLSLGNADTLTDIYLSFNESDTGFDHWIEYGQFYHHNLHKVRSLANIKMLEIGVQSGGSSRVWNKYFSRSKFSYIGVDINKECKRYESAPRIHIEIGSQLDKNFLHKMCKDFGPFDFIVDDGGHTTEMITTTFDVLWSPECLNDQAFYVVEDTHTVAMWAASESMYVGTGSNRENLFQWFSNLMKEQVAYFAPPEANMVLTERAKHLKTIIFMDSLIGLHYQSSWKNLTGIKRGNFIKYGKKTTPDDIAEEEQP